MLSNVVTKTTQHSSLFSTLRSVRVRRGGSGGGGGGDAERDPRRIDSKATFRVHHDLQTS